MHVFPVLAGRPLILQAEMRPVIVDWMNGHVDGVRGAMQGGMHVTE